MWLGRHEWIDTLGASVCNLVEILDYGRQWNNVWRRLLVTPSYWLLGRTAKIKGQRLRGRATRMCERLLFKEKTCGNVILEPTQNGFDSCCLAVREIWICNARRAVSLLCEERVSRMTPHSSAASALLQTRFYLIDFIDRLFFSFQYLGFFPSFFASPGSSRFYLAQGTNTVFFMLSAVIVIEQKLM